jgi:hypothetical protein
VNTDRSVNGHKLLQFLAECLSVGLGFDQGQTAAEFGSSTTDSVSLNKPWVGLQAAVLAQSFCSQELTDLLVIVNIGKNDVLLDGQADFAIRERPPQPRADEAEELEARRRE